MASLSSGSSLDTAMELEDEETRAFPWKPKHLYWQTLIHLEEQAALLPLLGEEGAGGRHHEDQTERQQHFLTFSVTSHL